MGVFCVVGGRELLSNALPCVLVTFCLLVIATPVAAPSVAAPSVTGAVQECLPPDGVAALKEIASSLNRSVTLLSNNWSWIKVQLLGLAGLLVLGIVTPYLVDFGRKAWRHWKSLRPRTLEDVFTPLMRQLSDLVAALGDRLTDALDRMATTIANPWWQLTVQLANEVAALRAQLDAEGVRMREMVMTIADVRAQLDEMSATTVDAKRKEEETNRKLKWLEERLSESDLVKRNPTAYLWPKVENSLEGVITEAHALRRARGFLSD